MFIELTTRLPAHGYVPSGVNRFLTEGECNRWKWRFKFWKRWVFGSVVVNGFGVIKRLDKIELRHQRILWINFSAPSIGDSLMDLSARVLLNDRQIDLLTHKKNVALYTGDTWFRRVSTEIYHFKAEEYDLVICDSFSPRVLFRKLLVAPLAPYVGIYAFLNGFEVHRTYFAFARMMELLALNRIIEPIRPTITLPAGLKDKPAEVDVCIAIGGEWSFRTYDHWLPIVSWLVTRGYSVSLVGSDNGVKKASEILKIEPSVRSTVAALSLPEVVAEICKARVFIGADGGLWHIACAIPIPSVVLFADCQIFDEESNRVTRETKDMVCESLYDDENVSNITSDSVVKAFERLVQRLNFRVSS